MYLVDIKRGTVKDDMDEECTYDTTMVMQEEIEDSKGFKIIE